MLRTSSVGDLAAEYVFDTAAQNRYLTGVMYNKYTGYVSAVGESYTGVIWDGYQVMTTASGPTVCSNPSTPIK